ncbi:MAG: hypothetical protein K0U61_02525 [Alphaproteobacteria bacterium]|nr:hypothetical protein [Alphaproteobacteria bacterium]
MEMKFGFNGSYWIERNGSRQTYAPDAFSAFRENVMHQLDKIREQAAKDAPPRSERQGEVL